MNFQLHFFASPLVYKKIPVFERYRSQGKYLAVPEVLQILQDEVADQEITMASKRLLGKELHAELMTFREELELN